MGRESSARLKIDHGSTAILFPSQFDCPGESPFFDEAASPEEQAAGPVVQVFSAAKQRRMVDVLRDGVVGRPPSAFDLNLVVPEAFLEAG